MVQSAKKIIEMSINKELWEKVLGWMIPASFSGVVFLIGFVALTQYQNTHQDKSIEDLKARMRMQEVQNYRFESLDKDIKYINDNIKDIKQAIKEINR